MPDENRALVERFYEEVISGGNVDALEELMGRTLSSMVLRLERPAVARASSSSSAGCGRPFLSRLVPVQGASRDGV